MEKDVKESLSDLVNQDQSAQGKVFVALHKLQNAHPMFSKMSVAGLRTLL